ncbi:MAG: amidohydrolase [Clostridium perfringens]|nr:amidohydrolase [Clostridium perfringens]
MSKQIYYNGPIITMDENYMFPEAILVENDKIKNVGSESFIFSLKDSNTKVIDLKNNTLIPSFIDSHSHITAFASTLNLVFLNNIKSFHDIISRLKDFKQKHNLGKDQWIIGFGYDHNDLPNKIHPTKDILDKASTENPILITHASGHVGVLNSLALEKLNITCDSKDIEGGRIGRIKDSLEPNGYLEENAFMSCAKNIPKPSLESNLAFLKKAQDIYLSYGITTCQEGMVNEEEFNTLKYASDTKSLKLDVIGYVDLQKSKFLMDNNKGYKNNYINRFKFGGYKIFLDGSPQGKTAWLTKPYKNSGDYLGYPIYKDCDVLKHVETSFKEDLQLLTHCNGDAAADQLIEAFNHVSCLKEYKNDIRPVMIHAQTVRYDQINKMKKFNIMPSYFVAHTYYWGDIHIENLGKERAFKISPAKTTLEEDLIFTFHQDTPVIPPNMLETVWCAVNRITKEGVLLGEEERIPVLDALKAVTINAAFQYFEENKKGSISEGKFADFVILDKNPLEVNPMDIKNIKILKTIKEGQVLYSNTL